MIKFVVYLSWVTAVCLWLKTYNLKVSYWYNCRIIYNYLARNVYKLEVQEIINEYPDSNRREKIDVPETQVWVTENKHMLEHQVWQVKDEGVFNHHLSRQPIQIVTLSVYLQCIFMNVSHPLNQPPKVTFANQQ